MAQIPNTSGNSSTDKPILTQSRLKELLHYDPETGVFTWLITTSRRYKVGRIAGCPGGLRGYLRIGYQRNTMYAHRLAFLYMLGSWPDGEVDHIDGCPTNNKWGNLRDVTRYVNAQNIRIAYTGSRTKLLGASYCKQRNKFAAHIQAFGTRKNLGYFDTADLAHEAYLIAKRDMHKGCTI